MKISTYVQKYLEMFRDVQKCLEMSSNVYKFYKHLHMSINVKKCLEFSTNSTNVQKFYNFYKCPEKKNIMKYILYSIIYIYICLQLFRNYRNFYKFQKCIEMSLNSTNIYNRYTAIQRRVTISTYNKNLMRQYINIQANQYMLLNTQITNIS